MIGKTGAGKTTVSALVALVCAARGQRVVAVDTDTNPNLGISLGVPPDQLGGLRPVPRALARGRGGGAVTPAQVLSGFGLVTPAGVTLLHAMQASEDGAGCGCPAHASDRSLLASALDDADVAVVDMEAGLAHLERSDGTLAHTDALLVVLEPSRKSVVSAQRMVASALRHGISRVLAVGNKAVSTEGDDAVLAEAAADCGIVLAATVSFAEAIVEADRSGRGLELPASGQLRSSLENVADSVLAP